MKKKFVITISKVIFLYSVFIAIVSIYLVFKLSNELTLVNKSITESKITFGSNPSNLLATFTDTDLKLSFQYPQNWNVTKDKSGTSININNYKLNDKEPRMIGNRFATRTTDKFDLNITMYEAGYSNTSSLVNWLKKNNFYTDAMCGEPISTQNTFVADRPALTLKYLGCPSHTIFSWKDRVYGVSYSPEDSDFSSEKSNILSTLELTDSQ